MCKCIICQMIGPDKENHMFTFTKTTTRHAPATSADDKVADIGTSRRSAQAVLHHARNVADKTGRHELADELWALILEDDKRKLFYSRPLSDLKVKKSKELDTYIPGTSGCLCGSKTGAISGSQASEKIQFTCLTCGLTSVFGVKKNQHGAS